MLLDGAPQDLFWWWQSALPEKVCEALIEDGERLHRAPGSVVGDETIVDTAVRDTGVAFFDREHWVHGLLEHYVRLANSTTAKWEYRLSELEPIQFSRYESGQHYTWHMDTFAGADGSARKLSIVVQLDAPSEYEGGDLQIRALHSFESIYTLETIRPRGSVVVFPGFLTHRVTPVTRGTRRSLVGWFRGPKFQ